MIECRTLLDAEGHINGLLLRLMELETRVRQVEKQLDTLGTPLWKRLLFRIDGWPPWWDVAHVRAWRPWHCWLRSS